MAQPPSRKTAWSKSWSLRTTLLLFATILVLSPIAMSFQALRAMQRLELKRLNEQVVRLAKDLADDLDRELGYLISLARAMASSPLLKAGDFAGFHAESRAAAGEIGGRLILLDSRIEPLVDTAAAWETTAPVNAVDAATAQHVLEGGKVAVTAFNDSADDRGWRPQVYVPVHRDDTLHVLVLTGAPRRIEAVARGAFLPADWYGRITDRAGRVLAEINRPPVAFIDSPEDGGAIEASDRLRLSDWSVLIKAKAAGIEQPLSNIELLWGIANATFVVLSMVGAIMLARFVGRPFEQAAEIAASIGRGELRPELRSGLAEAVNLASALTEADRELRQRTRALKEARDIARQRAREAEESRALLGTLLEHVPIGITIALGPPDFPIIANSRVSLEQLGGDDSRMLGRPAGHHMEGMRVFRADGREARPEDLPLYRASHAGEIVRDEEWHIERADGSRIICLVDATPLRDEAGNIIGAVNCWRDITARKHEEARLREVTALAKAVSEATRALIYVKDREGRITMANPALLRALQLSEAEVIGRKELGLHSEGSVDASDQTVIETGSAVEMEERLTLADGVRYFLSSKSPVFAEDGSVAAVVGVSVDITDRRRAEATARLLSEIDHDSAHLSDAQEIIRRAVRRVGAFLGVSRCHLAIIEPSGERVTVEPGWLDNASRLEGSYDISDAVTPELRAALREQQVIAVDDVRLDPRTAAKADLYNSTGIGAFATYPVSSAGALRALLSVHAPQPRHWRADELALLREVAARVWFARERALSEAALRASEERYRLAAQAMQGMIFDIESDTGFVERSQGLFNLLGFRPEDVPPSVEWWRQRCHPEDLPRITEERQAALSEHLSNLQTQYRVRHRDGHWVHVQERSLVVYHLDGRPKRWIGSVIDVTAQINAEIRLRETEERFRALVEASAQAVWTADASGQFIEDSASWRAFTGQSAKQLLGWGWLDALHPEDRDAAAEAWRKAVSGRDPMTFEYRLWHRSGEWRWTQVRAVPLLNPDGTVRSWVGMNMDVTERRKWEQQQKLLLSELSHRVKNVLAVVQSMATRTLTSGRSLSEASDIFTRRLQALSRAHDMLIKRDWRGAPLRAIVDEELAPFAGRARIEGPDIMVGPRTAQTLALVLHELATNATKHGALSNDEGQVEVTWSVTGEGRSARFAFQWREKGGPPVSQPVKKGFGSALLTIAISDDESAAPQLRFEPEGVVYEINIPLTALA